MPTREILGTFWRDWDRLSSEQQRAFLAAIRQFIADLSGGQGFRKGVRGHPGVFEMTRAPDGRATFAYGTSPHPGEAHIVWHRIGAHEIFRNP